MVIYGAWACQERKETDGKAELDMEDKKVIRSVGNSTSEWNEFPLHSYIVDISWQWRDVCDILMHCLVICIRQVAPKQFLYLTMLMTIELNPLRKSSTTWSLPYSLRYCYDIYDLLQGVLRRHYFTGILAVLAHQEISWTIQEILWWSKRPFLDEIAWTSPVPRICRPLSSTCPDLILHTDAKHVKISTSKRVSEQSSNHWWIRLEK